MTDTALTFTRPLGPFEILYRPRVRAKPVAPAFKRDTRTKAEQSAIALESEAERATRQAAERTAKEAAILRNNSYSDSARATNSDKTNAIVGRRNSARSQ